jgi:putative membrane protein
MPRAESGSREPPRGGGIQWAPAPERFRRATQGIMMMRFGFAARMGGAALALAPAAFAHGDHVSDAQIAHIAYTAGAIDIDAGKLALARSKDPAVRAFAEEMVRDHQAVNDKALALVKALGVTPEDNPTSAALAKQAAAQHQAQAALTGAAFDRAYVANEVAYHRAVNAALTSTLIPDATNAELKSLLETGLTLFSEHQAHAEHLAASLK